MLEALREHFPPAATWTEPEGGLFIWATLPEYIDTGDLLAKALRADVAFVPGAGRLRRRARGATRCGSTSPASTTTEIREGIRRIGKVIAEQVELYGAAHRRAASGRRPGSSGARWRRSCLPFRKTGEGSG